MFFFHVFSTFELIGSLPCAITMDQKNYSKNMYMLIILIINIYNRFSFSRSNVVNEKYVLLKIDVRTALCDQRKEGVQHT